MKSDGDSEFNYESLIISFDSTADENETIEGVVVQVVSATDSSQPIGNFTVYSPKLTAISCGELEESSGEFDDYTKNTLIRVEGNSTNSFKATWVPLQRGKHQVFVSVIRTSIYGIGYRNNEKVFNFTVVPSSSFLTGMLANLMILCLYLD